MSLEETLAAHTEVMRQNTEAMVALTRALLGVEKRGEETPSLQEQRVTVAEQEIKAEDAPSQALAATAPAPEVPEVPAAPAEKITEAMLVKEVGKAATINRALLVEILGDFKVQKVTQLSQADRAMFLERVRAEILS